MITMDLTTQEAVLIKEMREKNKEIRAYQRITIEILRAAYEYEDWLQKNGRASSYSTFCDEFGYGADKTIYNCVEKIRTMAIARGKNIE